MIKIEHEDLPEWAEGMLSNAERRYRLIVDGEVVKEHISLDQAVAVICRRDGETKG